MKEKGYKPFLKLENGTTELEINLAAGKPRTYLDKKYDRKKYVLELIRPEGNCLSVSERLYMSILEKLALRKDGRVKITKVGTGKETRYEVL